MNHRGFTLMELLVVVTIMGLMLAVMIPAGNAFDTRARITVTQENLRAIRTAILGSEAAYDSHGRRLLGGYVGDVGALPRLYAMAWSPSLKRMDIVVSAGDTVFTTNHSDQLMAGALTGDTAAQPLALWRPELGKREIGYRRAYLQNPVDPMPNDHFDHYSDLASDEREFKLREGKGRLTDGWGKSLVVYVDDVAGDGLDNDTLAGGEPCNLVFISAGPDGKYDDWISDPSNPKDVDNDNIEMRILEADWNYDDNVWKITKTRETLQRIQFALLGDHSMQSEKGYEPYGYLADMGSLDTLENLGLDVLIVNKDYVYYNGLVYRCQVNHDNHADDCTGIPGISAEWIVDNELILLDTINYKYSSAFSYTDFYLSGWKRPYISGHPSLPIIDAWGRSIEPLFSGDSLYLISRGADTSSINTADDLVLTISPAQYQGSLRVTVNSVAAFASGDAVRVIYTQNGRLDSIQKSLTPTTMGPSTEVIEFTSIPMGRRHVHLVLSTGARVEKNNIRIYPSIVNEVVFSP